MTLKRRSLIQGAAAGGVISMLDWLSYFRQCGVPGTAKSLGMASAVAQEVGKDPKFLIYWFQEGGWDSYSMFAPIETPNHATLNIAAGTLNPNPSWSAQFYRPRGYGDAAHHGPKTTGNITAGFLADGGTELFGDMAVVSSHLGNQFHSGGRLDYHYGNYEGGLSPSGVRQPTERSVLQAFCEATGSALPLAHVSWHRWLSDGELDESNYREGTGYYDKLGPTYAHTNYGRTPTQMRNRLASIVDMSADVRSQRIRQFVDNLHTEFLKDKNSETVQSFDSAVKRYRQLTATTKVATDPKTMFTDAALRGEFGVMPGDEDANAKSINGNPARSKECPNTNVQALMTFELMTKGLSNGFWIENRDIREFDTHADRRGIRSNAGQTDQTASMQRNLWTPLKALVKRLKATPLGSSGKSYFDNTTIVLASEMGRTIQGEVKDILAKQVSNDEKYKEILEQDCCSHWRVNSVAFLGGTVKGNTQYGKVGSSTLSGIPIRPDGTLDPAYDPNTGALKGTKDPKSVVTNAGHVYATALELAGVSSPGKGRNREPALAYVKK